MDKRKTIESKEDELLSIKEYRSFYNNMVRGKILVLLLILVALVGLMILDIATGPASISFSEVISTILQPQQQSTQIIQIIWKIRLPIAIMAVLVGSSLGIAGAEMQTILDNPLASPYTLGISSAASFGAALGILMEGKSILPVNEYLIVPVNAFIFAMIACFFVYAIAKLKRGASSVIVLAGVAINLLFNSLVSFLQYSASDTQLSSIVFWMFGSLQNATWGKVALLAVVLCITVPIFVFDSWKLTALKLGDTRAKGMGIDVEKLRLKTLILISIITAVSVCFVGTIGFIGLAAPHIARSFVGEDQRFYLPTSALAGALILSFSSVLSKNLIPGTIFPVGITTSFIGIPFLLSIILRERKV
ncbi:MAG TPA: iron ABC transporter permease [Clostridium sp.]|nr:iron ABC transporter permease [Clostridium sp.]